MRFAVLATDLDGTLLRSDRTVSPRTRRALVSARERGARHVVVTGRQVSGCRALLDDLGYRGVAVCSQGAQVYDHDRGRLLWSATLDRATARDLVERVTAEAGPVGVAVATAGLTGRVLLTPGFYSRPGPEHETVDARRLWSRPIEKLFLRHKPLGAAGLAALVTRLSGDSVTVTWSHGTVAEILPAGVTKAHGLALAGFTGSDTIAFGDMPNDIPMFEWSAYGVAMGNAGAALKAVADEVAPSNDDDGVAVTLESLYDREPVMNRTGRGEP